MVEGGNSERDSARHSMRFGIGVEEMREIMNNYRERRVGEEIEMIQALGGIDAFQKLLCVNFETGLHGTDFSSREEVFSHNRRDVIKRKSFWFFCSEALKDKIMQILLAMGIFTLIAETSISDDKEIAWLEGFAIVFAVIVVVLVTATNDLQKAKKFEELQRLQQKRHHTNVFRSGKLTAMHPSELMVGDIIELSDGTVIPSDGILISADSLEIDESAMTGENDHRKKLGYAESLSALTNFLHQHPEAKELNDPRIALEVPSPVCISGTTVAEGRGKLLVIAVGKNSVEGFFRDMTSKDSEQTPLEAKLDNVAGLISKVGLYCGALALFVLFLRLTIEMSIGTLSVSNARITDSLHFILISITVLVVAIPEGLPLAVTISLAYSVKKMQKENNLVKRLAACETMGGADMICSDKTGTLTTNKMTVVKYWFDGNEIAVGTSSSTLTQHPEYFAKLKEGICMTTNARMEDSNEFGSKTELALLKMLMAVGHDDYIEVRERCLAKPHKVFPFSSSRKRSSIILTCSDSPTGYRAYVIGASEIVLKSCVSYLSASGEAQAISTETRAALNGTIEGMASGGLRTLSIAFRDLPSNFEWETMDENGWPVVEADKLVCLGIAGIVDPVRKGVPEAVQKCKAASIHVRMVTGDNRITAAAIARECGILTREEGGVMEGKEFNDRVGGIVCGHCGTKVCPCAPNEDSAERGQKVRTEVIANLEVFKELVSGLDVMARSQPEHKYVLVTGLMQLGHVVAVTGDGTNDAPALKKADVGFAMGIAGTEHAREAADIILLDDNFSSIVNATRWGRNIYDSIQKFIQFQLTVNVVAVSAAIIGAVTIKQSPLTAVQMLWVNLIMDTFASLALATEPPTEALLFRKPQSRHDNIITALMWKHILGQAVLQCTLIFTMMYAGEFFLLEDADESERVLKDGDYVISGRLYKLNGEKAYYDKQEDPDIGPSRHFTIIFNSFVLMQLFNEFNSRCIKDEIWVFRGIHKNLMFIYIWLFTLFMQIILVEFGREPISCHIEGLTPIQWLICIGFGLTTFPWRLLLLLIPNRCFSRLEKTAPIGEHRNIVSSLRRNTNSVHGSLQINH